MLALQVAADGFDILRVDGCHHHRPVVALACSWIGGQIFVDWVRCQHGIVVAESECVMARPAVAAWIVDHRCAQWVEFDIAVALQEIVAIFDQTGFVAAFPQCPAAVVGVVEVADIASAQRLQSARDRAGSLRCEQQVDVIGHQHVSAKTGSGSLIPEKGVKRCLKTGSGSLIPVPAIGWVGRLMRGARTGEGKAGKG